MERGFIRGRGPRLTVYFLIWNDLLVLSRCSFIFGRVFGLNGLSCNFLVVLVLYIFYEVIALCI